MNFVIFYFMPIIKLINLNFMNKTIVWVVTLWIWTLVMNAFQDDSSVVQVPTVPNQVISESNTPSAQPKKAVEQPKEEAPSKEADVIVPKKVEVQKAVEQPKETIKIQEVIPEPKKVEVRATSNCDPNYSWCVPIASDVDCAGWKWNWPAYVRWPVQVIWSDIYDLDRDNDWWGCE